MRYIVAMDQGTTSSRAVVFQEDGSALASHAIEFAQHYPNPGWVEHDPYDIYYSQLNALKIAVSKAGIRAQDIAAVGITNQRETTILWDKNTGRPVCPAIVWQCRRTAPYIEEMKRKGWTDTIRAKTGLIPDAYFCASKLMWMLDNVHGLRERAKMGELLFGTVDCWLIWNLTKDHLHVTDATNASRTMLYNIHENRWDDELLSMFDLPREILPTVVDSSGVVGELAEEILGCEGIPVAGIAGDQQAALFGQACYDEGMVKTTYGTGGFLLMNTGEHAKDSNSGLLTTIAWRIGGKTTYALEGSIFVAGAVIQWLRDEMHLLETAAQSQELAQSIPSSDGVYFVPAFTGLGAPYWDMYSRGTILGLTRGTGRAHIVRAALEGIAYEVCDVVSAMEQDSGISLMQMRVDGGASANAFLMGFQADTLGIDVVRPQIIETTAAGAAYLAGLAVDVWKDMAQIKAMWRTDTVFTPSLDENERLRLLAGWKKAVSRAKDWAE